MREGCQRKYRTYSHLLIVVEDVPIERTESEVKCTEDDHLSVEKLVDAAAPAQQQFGEPTQPGLRNVERVCDRHGDAVF